MIEVIARPFTGLASFTSEDAAIYRAQMLRGLTAHVRLFGDRADADRMLFLVANAPGESLRQMGLHVEKEKTSHRGGRL